MSIHSMLRGSLWLLAALAMPGLTWAQGLGGTGGGGMGGGGMGGGGMGGGGMGQGMAGQTFSQPQFNLSQPSFAPTFSGGRI
ncbi:MAG TPA: hypothetical protein PKD86_06275, partial [Gemmatales bacterium]|nr:hypothetical protein [Gemmatales bacterium]